MLKGFRAVAKPRPVAIYRAPPNVKFVRIEWVYICVEKTSKTGEREPNCFAKRKMAFQAPRSTNSRARSQDGGITNTDVWHTLQKQWQEGDHEDKQYAYDGVIDPLKDRHKIVTPSLASDELASCCVLANGQLGSQGAQENH